MMTSLEIVSRKELAHDCDLAFALEKAYHDEMLCLNIWQLLKDSSDTIVMINERIFSIADMQSRYVITSIHDR